VSGCRGIDVAECVEFLIRIDLLRGNFAA
jgi:hypothetical protein